MATPILLLDVDVHDGSSVVTKRVGSHSWVSRPSDSPANTIWRAGLQSAGEFRRGLDLSFEGRGEQGFGYVVFSNADGEFDEWFDYGYGRSVVLRRLASKDTPLASAEVLLRAIARNVESEDAGRTVKLRLRDPLDLLKRPLQTARYAGTTTGATNTIEGDESLIDVVKPRALGNPNFAAPKLVNASFRTYQISTAPYLGIGVFEGGVAIPQGTNFSSVAALHAATVAPGTCITARSLGLFRMGSTPTLPLRCQIQELGGGSLAQASRLAGRLVTEAGLTVDAASFASYLSFDGAIAGIFVDDESSYFDVIAKLLATCEGTLIPTESGTVGIARLYDPVRDSLAPASVTTFTERDISRDSDFTLLSSKVGGVDGAPAYMVTSSYLTSWDPLSESEIAGAASASLRGNLLNGFLAQDSVDNAILTKHPNAPRIRFDTIVRGASAGAAQALRRLSMLKKRRDFVSLRVPRTRAAGCLPGRTATIGINRFGWASAKKMLITGRTDHFASLKTQGLADMVTLEMWG